MTDPAETGGRLDGAGVSKYLAAARTRMFVRLTTREDLVATSEDLTREMSSPRQETHRAVGRVREDRQRALRTHVCRIGGIIVPSVIARVGRVSAIDRVGAGSGPMVRDRRPRAC
jgi:hypothetical protein